MLTRVSVGIVVAVFSMVLCLLVTASSFAQTVLLSEDFDGLALVPNVDEALAEDNAWTNTPPDGWSINNDDLPGGGVTEWRGWSFADFTWWATTAEDQRRVEFTLAQNTVAVVDPDEWDDIARDDGFLNSYLSTPSIDISNVAANSAVVSFSSSWRPEDSQSANLTVSFDGGAPVEILLFLSDAGSADFKDDNSTNEELTIDIPNPSGARGMVLAWGMFDAGNDWWWAIDNVEVTGEVSTSAVNAKGKLATTWANIKK